MMSMEMMIRIGLAIPALKLGMERVASSIGSKPYKDHMQEALLLE